MRRAILALAIAAGLAACGFDTRTEALRCDNNDDCDDFRRCVEGFCQVIGTTCHPDCDRCEDGICVIDCSEPDACPSTVRCPPSVRCLVFCTGAGSCRGGIDCTMANRCNPECLGDNSCAGPIDCASSDCEVDCRGPGACSGGVDCTDACACDTQCTDSGGNRTCLPDCPSGCDNGTDCVSDGCDECSF